MILTAEENRQNGHQTLIVVDIEIEYRPLLRDGSQSRKNVWPQRALMRGFAERLHLVLDAFDPKRGVFRGVAASLAEFDVALEQEIKNGGQITVCFQRPLDAIVHSAGFLRCFSGGYHALRALAAFGNADKAAAAAGFQQSA